MPSEWDTAAKFARKNPEPYHVKRLSFSDFLNFKERRQQRFPRNLKIAMENLSNGKTYDSYGIIK